MTKGVCVCAHVHVWEAGVGRGASVCASNGDAFILNGRHPASTDSATTSTLHITHHTRPIGERMCNIFLYFFVLFCRKRERERLKWPNDDDDDDNNHQAESTNKLWLILAK